MEKQISIIESKARLILNALGGKPIDVENLCDVIREKYDEIQLFYMEKNISFLEKDIRRLSSLTVQEYIDELDEKIYDCTVEGRKGFYLQMYECISIDRRKGKLGVEAIGTYNIEKLKKKLDEEVSAVSRQLIDEIYVQDFLKNYKAKPLEMPKVMDETEMLLQAVAIYSVALDGKITGDTDLLCRFIPHVLVFQNRLFSQDFKASKKKTSYAMFGAFNSGFNNLVFAAYATFIGVFASAGSVIVPKKQSVSQCLSEIIYQLPNFNYLCYCDWSSTNELRYVVETELMEREDGEESEKRFEFS